MGILNVTPDSFSDGGKFLARDRAVAHALQMLDDGADILDIGGESTRPGARIAARGGSESAQRGVSKSAQSGASKTAGTSVSAAGTRVTQAAQSGVSGAVGSGVSKEAEMKRVLPVIEDVLRERPSTVISVDTYKSEVARAAVEAGGEIVNDVSALRWDQNMPSTLAGLQCGVILMHTRGRPEEWGQHPPSPDIVGEVRGELRAWSAAAMACGIGRDRLVLDPGFGFGKRFQENYPLLGRFNELHDLGFPLLSGTSRKSFIGRTLAHDGKDAPAEQRLFGTVATVTASVLQGAHIVRVHDVKPAVEAVRVADEVLRAG
jgi:dihydropteroate synthase